MSERTVLVVWGCSCPQELNGEVPPIITKLVSAEKEYVEEDGGWVVMYGYSEQCSRCKTSLGGYGDVDLFQFKEDADKAIKKAKREET